MNWISEKIPEYELPHRHMFRNLTIVYLLIASLPGVAQVNQIKDAASASHVTRAEGGGSGGNLAFDIFFNIFFAQIIELQQQKLQRRDEVPSMISVEAMVQAAAQPASYYLVNPRIRANWGLFSTDFRFNYLVEESIGETQYLRTDDWQIVQLNLVTTRDAFFRVGGGIMHEAFSGGKIYGEWTTALEYHPHQSRTGGFAEYRNAEQRKEVSAMLQYKIFDHRSMHGYVTGGAVYQKYYRTVAVWGMQGGMMIKVY
jgi:hypothetical protein